MKRGLQERNRSPINTYPNTAQAILSKETKEKQEIDYYPIRYKL